MKNFLIVAVMLVLFNGLLLYSGALDRLANTQKEVQPAVTVDPDIVDVFRFTLQEEVNKKMGQPIEGYEPHMFLEVFPGLVETDFDGVVASIGRYEVVNGLLVYQSDNTKLIHSAAKAISRQGSETLLNNVAARAGIDLSNDGTITDIVNVIVSQ